MKSIIKNLSLMLMGCCIALYPFIARIILKKIPQDISTDLTMFKIIFFCCLIIGSLILTIFYCYQWLKYKKFFKPKLHTTNILINFKEYFKTYLLNPYMAALQSLDNFIKHTLLKDVLGKNLKNGMLYLHTKMNFTQKNITNIFFYFVLLPKILFLTVFFIDVFILSKYLLMYHLGFLMLIPLIFNYAIFTYKEFSEYNINAMNIDILVFKMDTGDIMTFQDHMEECTQRALYQYSERYYYNVIELGDSANERLNGTENVTVIIFYYSQQFHFFKKIRTDIALIDLLKSKYGFLFESFKYLCYCFLWTFLLYVGFIYKFF